MKIGIDISVLNINQAGTATYTRNLINAFKDIDSKDEFHFFSVNQKRDMSSPKTFKSRLQTIYRDIIWTHGQLPYQASKCKIDVLHMPANIIPMWISCPTVVTIHDTATIQFPEIFTYWNRKYYQAFLPVSSKNASVILTVSNFSKRELVGLLKVNPNKVIVTYNAVSPEFRKISQKKIEYVKNKYNLNRFILTVGTIEPRKNLSRLLKAYALLRRDGFHYKLVHAGPYGWLSNGISREVEQLGLYKEVVFLGRVSLDELVALYNSAFIFVYPSLYEGFGLPVLEAMACGCPVITSNNSSLPEVAGEAAVMIDPYDVAQIAYAIEDLYKDQRKVNRLIERGFNRVKAFSWENCAEKTIAAYHLAIEGR